jgi:hypothetical protein
MSSEQILDIQNKIEGLQDQIEVMFNQFTSFMRSMIEFQHIVMADSILIRQQIDELRDINNNDNIGYIAQ